MVDSEISPATLATTVTEAQAKTDRALALMWLVANELPIELKRDGFWLVEVGVHFGANMRALLTSLPFMFYVGIDPYTPCPGHFNRPFRSFNARAEVKKLEADYPHRARIIEAPSVLAATYFQPNTIQIVHIDGAHDEANVLADLKAWWPIVKKKGLLCGHDYLTAPEVKPTVDAFFADKPSVHVIGGKAEVWWVKKPA